MIVLVRHSYHRVVWGRLQVTDSGHKRTLHRQSLLRVNRYSLGAHREPLDVRFAPKATELLRRREMSRCAKNRRGVRLWARPPRHSTTPAEAVGNGDARSSGSISA